MCTLTHIDPCSYFSIFSGKLCFFELLWHIEVKRSIFSAKISQKSNVLFSGHGHGREGQLRPFFGTWARGGRDEILAFVS